MEINACIGRQRSRLRRSFQSFTTTEPLLILPAASITPKCKSLPNINLFANSKILPTVSDDLVTVTLQTTDHKKNRPQIFKKTWNKVKKTILNPSVVSSGGSPKRDRLKNPPGFHEFHSSSAPNTPIIKESFEFSVAKVVSERSQQSKPEEGDENVEKIQKSYVLLQKRLSEELRQIVRGGSPSQHHCSSHIMKYETKDNPNPGHTTTSTSGYTNPVRNSNAAENLSEEFKKKLQQWEMWKASTGKVTYTDEQLKSILPQDFTKKLHEWECKKGTTVLPNNIKESKPSTTAGKKARVNRKKQKNSEAARQKELAWLDKQLDKIEQEKKRLEREMKKYLDKERRLQKMKEALNNNPGKEADVWIRTPTANCKVEKITEKFAKKLYEWEEQQGIQPESSTMALLTPEYLASSPPKRYEQEQEDDDSSPLLVREIELMSPESNSKGFEDDYEDEDLRQRTVRKVNLSTFSIMFHSSIF